MKTIIIVHNAYDNIYCTKESIESIRHAANRWKSNFFEITHFQFPNSPDDLFWQRIWMFENFLEYDLVLNLDVDIIINSNSPNIFNELTDEYDFAAVLDGNPGGRFVEDDWYRKRSHDFSKLHDSLYMFKKYIPNFNEKIYSDIYFNAGVFLFRPKIMNVIIQNLKNIMFDNVEFYNYFDKKKNKSIYAGQNILSAILSPHVNRLKLLDNTWNWIAPDDLTEYNESMFLGKMKPNIYHFTGTDGSKDSIKNYDRWK